MNIRSPWFFTEAPLPLRILLIYIRGDAIVLIPFLLLTLIITMISTKWGLVLISVYIAMRGLGEMIYWLLQQFGDRKYRPYDFGFRQLDNNAIYILYQLLSLVVLVLGTTVTLYLLTVWK